VSNVMSDTIILSFPVLSSLKINDGVTATALSTVTLNNTWTNGTPTEYMASESSTFAVTNVTTTAWLPYDAAPVFKLSSAKGTKTVYLKLRNASGYVSNVKSDTISKTAVTTPAPKTATTASSAATEAAAKAATAKAAIAVTTPETDTPVVPGGVITDVVTTPTLAAKPNLQVTDYKVGEAPDGTFVASLVIGNDGNAAAGMFHVALYFWTSDTLSLTDAVLVQEVVVDGVAAGAETTAVFNSMMPDLGNNAVVVCPVFAIDSQSEIAPFDPLTGVFNTNTLFTVAP